LKKHITDQIPALKEKIDQEYTGPLEPFKSIKNNKQNWALCMTDISSSDSNPLLAISSDRDINIYAVNMANLEFSIVKVLKGHKSEVRGMISLNESKSCLLSCGEDGKCKLWDMVSGSCLRTFRGHTGMILNVVQLSKSTFASCGREVKFWNIYTGECLKTVESEQDYGYVDAIIRISDKKIGYAEEENLKIISF